MHHVLVTGATGRVGRVVVDQRLDARVPVRARDNREMFAAARGRDMLFQESIGRSGARFSASELVRTKHGQVRQLQRGRCSACTTWS